MDKKDIDDLVNAFLEVKTLRELAACLKVEYSILTYYLYRVKGENKYIEFEIKKKNGGSRSITAPIQGIKYIQTKLNIILQHIFPPKEGIHGFTLSKSIKSNATAHLRKRIIVNLDLKDFFPSINFGRIRGLFLARPFSFNSEVATALAQICCYKNSLPQGAPTSPVLSNFICRRLDNAIIRLSAANRCTYTRYADDITISTNLKILPSDIGVIDDNKLVLDSKFIQIIQTNGFTINEAKTRYAFRTNRQEVTGLIINEIINVNRKYIRNVRAMLHSWETFGVTLAANEHFAKYSITNKILISNENAFKNELVGKIGFIGFVKGKKDPIYKKLLARLNTLAPDVRLKIIQDEVESQSNPIVYGEGKSDWRHLKKSFENLKQKGLYRNIFLTFHEYKNNDEINNEELLSICRNLPKISSPKNKVIFLFDRDVKSINNQVTQGRELYKKWGKNVYSLLMPNPTHRSFEEVCIEHYYLDDDLKTVDHNGRRIYLSNEFDSLSGQHLTESLSYNNPKYLRAKYPRILDSGIRNHDGKSMALSKINFSENILEGNSPFDNISFDHFKLIFDEIEKIINLAE